jgi:uncharacterized protein YndB with AHSA1/START domain
MIHADASATIRRPIAEVFSYVTDPTNEPAWHTDAAEARPLTDGPIGVGSRIAYVFPFMGRRSTSIREVVAFEPPHLEAIHFESGPFGLKPRITYRFEDLGASVRFTRQAESDTPGLTRLIAPVMQRLLASRSALFVENLRRLLEGTSTDDA